MKILLVTEFFPKDRSLRFTGGVEARTYYLYSQLKKKHQVQVISRATRHAIPVNFLSVFSRLSYIFKATFQGLKNDPDIVEGSNFVSYIPAYIIARLKRVPAVAWYPDVFKGTWVNKFGITGLFGEVIESISLKLNWDHFIALSEQTKKKLITHGINPKKISVVYASIDQKQIKKIKVKKYTHPTICCISRLVEYKQVNDLITAFALLSHKISNIKLIVVGRGPEKENLKKLAKKLNVASNISWYQNLTRTQVLTFLKRSHIFCHPSVVEGFGLVTLEALVAQAPYVNADIPITREITNNGHGGLLFTPRNPQDLSDRLFKLLTNKTTYRQKLLQGKALAKKYNLYQSANQPLQVYKTVLR